MSVAALTDECVRFHETWTRDGPGSERAIYTFIYISVTLCIYLSIYIYRQRLR